MNVYTYHIDVEGINHARELVELWSNSWRKAGWNPIVLTREDARKHPRYEELVNHFNNHLPTINPKQYELACYERWLAMSCVGGGWMSDNDVINWSFFPNLPLTNDLIIYSKGGLSPCLVHGGIEQYELGIRLFLEHRGGALSEAHSSDQDILNLHLDKIKHCGLVSQHGTEGWDNACLVHFCNASMVGKQPRYEWIPKVRPLP